MKVLQTGTQDPNVAVRTLVADVVTGNPGTPVAELRRLLRDGVPRVRLFAAAAILRRPAPPALERATAHAARASIAAKVRRKRWYFDAGVSTNVVPRAGSASRRHEEVVALAELHVDERGVAPAPAAARRSAPGPTRSASTAVRRSARRRGCRCGRCACENRSARRRGQAGGPARDAAPPRRTSGTTGARGAGAGGAWRGSGGAARVRSAPPAPIADATGGRARG